jgi:hypothetical protein
MVWEERIARLRVDVVVRQGTFVDRHTGSRFDLFGRAVSGALKGRRLEAVPQITSFRFAWSRFYPIPSWRKCDWSDAAGNAAQRRIAAERLKETKQARRRQPLS